MSSLIRRPKQNRRVARQQFHFLCSDKEKEAKESLALRWACLARQGGNINSTWSI